jgi:hypothetical protein
MSNCAKLKLGEFNIEVTDKSVIVSVCGADGVPVVENALKELTLFINLVKSMHPQASLLNRGSALGQYGHRPDSIVIPIR